MSQISIIVPVFNSQTTIEKCLNSLVNQTFSDIEIIVINDGSTDRSVEEINKIKDNRIKLINKSNTGVSDSRNVGLNHVNSKYVTFVDSDDWVEDTYIEKMIRYFEKENVDIVCCSYFENYEKNDFEKKVLFENNKITNYEALNPSSKYYFTPVWGKIFKYELVKNIRFDLNIFYSEDTLFYTQVLLNSNSIYWCDDLLYHYSMNSNSAIHNKVLSKYITDFYARKEIYLLYCKNFHDSKLQDKAKIYAMYSAINFLFEFKKNLNEKIDISELIDFIKNCKIIDYLKSDFILMKDKLKLFLILKLLY